MKIQQVFGHVKAAKQVTTATTTSFLLSPLLLATLLFSRVSSQLVDQPAPVYQAEFTSYNDKTLYIRGGLNQGYPAKQLYALDISPLLTYSNKLTWRKLDEAGPIEPFRADLPLAVNRENQAIFNFAETGQMAEYNIALGRWTSGLMRVCFTPEVPLDSVRSSLRSTMDSKTGLIYIVGGWNGTEILVYNPAGKECSSLPLPPAFDAYYYLYHAWSESKNTIYVFGETAPTKGPAMWEFQVASKTWKRLPAQGTPPPLWDHKCMTSAFGGQKLVIFGGTDGISIVSGDIHIFDTTTYTWTKGAVSPNARDDAICGSSGDFFIVWGGRDANLGNNSPTEILFYNMRTNQWVKQSDIVPPSSNITTIAPPPILPPLTSSGTIPSTTTGPGS
ncbi:hypothetical protein BGW39_000453, partial [Mortierella sp. 14UC]